MSYPVDLQLEAPLEVARWRPFLQGIMALPHIIIANVLDDVAAMLALVSWFSIVFTGRMPEGIANLQCMILRYETRTLGYMSFLHETYPPFEFTMTGADPGTHPLRVDVTPQLEDRNRLSVGFRLFALIPIVVFGAFVAIGAACMMVVGAFAVLFTGRWPERVRGFIVKANRLMVRVNAYGRLLVDEYPPFALEER